MAEPVIFCAVSSNATKIGQQLLAAAMALQKAAEAAEVCNEICQEIMMTAMSRVPVVCKFLRLGQLFPEDGEAVDLDAAMRQCCRFAFDTLHEALNAVYSYLQNNKLSQMMQAADLTKLLNKKKQQLRDRFDDMNAYMILANLLASKQSAEQAQHTTKVVRELQHHVQSLQLMQTCDKAQVRAHAQAVLARQSPEGQRIRVSRKEASAVAASPCGTLFATAAEDKTAAVWDAAAGTRMHELRGHSAWVRAVAWSPDGSRVATASDDHTAAVWDTATGKRMHELRGHSSAVTTVAWSPDGSSVATGSRDGTAAVWEAGTGVRMHELQGDSSEVSSVAWSPDGDRVVTGSADGTAVVWDAAAGTRMHVLTGHSAWVRSVEWSPDGSRLATASEDSTAAVWDAATGHRMHELVGHSSKVVTVMWSPEGSRVATAAGDKTAAVWDAATGSRMHELRAHRRSILSARRGTEVSKVAMAPTSSGATLWDAATELQEQLDLATFAELRSIAWSPDGACLYTAADDGTVHIYNISRRN